jgi:hypothetical protein
MGFPNLNIFKKKEKPSDVGSINMEPPKMREIKTTEVGMENTNARMDLVATKLESLGIKYDMLNERLDRIEKLLNAIYELARQ